MRRLRLTPAATLRLSAQGERLHRFSYDHDQNKGPDFFAVAKEARKLIDDANSWMVEQMGPPGERWHRNGWNFYLRDKVDATAFRLWWC